MRNEFIVTSFNLIVQALCSINVVEYVKSFTAWVYALVLNRELCSEEIRAAKGIGIDIFQVIKFSVIIAFIACGVQASLAKYITYYLIASNAFTYFYYHAWGSPYKRYNDLNSQRRRFVNFLLAILFYILCYAHLYQHHFANFIIWPNNQADAFNAVYLSVANAFTLTYGGFAPNTQGVRILFMTELINTFIFFSIILSNSIPSINNEN